MAKASGWGALQGGLLLGGGPLLAGVLIVVIYTSTLVVAKDTVTWSSTEGVITRWHHRPPSSSESFSVTHFDYRYTVDGAVHEGERVS